VGNRKRDKEFEINLYIYRDDNINEMRRCYRADVVQYKRLLRGNVLNTQIYNRFHHNNKQAEQAFVVLFSFEIYNRFLKNIGYTYRYNIVQWI
jgi:hypothetical protein